MPRLSARRGFLALGLGSTLAAHSLPANSASPRSERAPSMANTPAPPYRPLAHYSPGQGFMNDPNGLIHHDGQYHLYYQYNPDEPVAGNVHWGHATSPDLYHWQTHPPVLFPDARGQAFSGSMVWDQHNTSGLFSGNTGGLVAIYTRAGPQRQTQEIAYSTDGGFSFTPYADNPILDIGTDAFRDPKVFWHAPSRRWVMVVARPPLHRVAFYVSRNLRNWTLASEWGDAGILGVDYECPDLVSVPVEGGGRRWVLFVSINPGSPLGGSAVQYFIGDFDGERFVPQDRAARLMDLGQDFYALQTFAGLPADEVVAMAWMSNWLYANAVPTLPGRGAMALPRRLSLRQRDGQWHLVQTPIDLSPWVVDEPLRREWEQASGTLATVPWSDESAMLIEGRGVATPDSRLVLALENAQGERLEVGLDVGTFPGFYVDRASLRGFSHPFWNHKAILSVTPGTRVFDFTLLLDRSSVELLALRGELAATLRHYFRNTPTQLQISLPQGQWSRTQMRVRRIKPWHTGLPG